MSKCKFPGCRNNKAGTFALVPLCEMHLDVIWVETRTHYRHRGKAEEARREQYDKIRYLIPWSQP